MMNGIDKVVYINRENRYLLKEKKNLALLIEEISKLIDVRESKELGH